MPEITDGQLAADAELYVQRAFEGESFNIVDGGINKARLLPPVAVEPPPPPPPGDDRFAGTVLKADYMNSSNPFTDGWGMVCNGYYYGTSATSWAASNDKQITTYTSGGWPGPCFDGQVHDNYRNLTVAGPQSRWDGPPLNKQTNSTRNQLGGWGGSSAFYRSPKGTRDVFVTPMRLQNPSVLPYNLSSGGGDTQFSQRWQSKSCGASSGTAGPIFQLMEGKNGLKLVFNNRSDPLKAYLFTSIPRGTWFRLAFDVLHGSTSSTGAFRLWIDRNDGQGWKALMDKVNGRTLGGSYTGNVYNLGIYNKTSLVDTTCDYGPIELVKRDVNDPW